MITKEKEERRAREKGIPTGNAGKEMKSPQKRDNSMYQADPMITSG